MPTSLAPGAFYTGYVRVSTTDQNPALQVQALRAFGVPENRIYIDYMTGAKMDRPQLKRALNVTREGDIVVVWKIDRLGRSVQGVLDVISDLNEEGIGLISLTDGFDTTTPQGRMIMTILLALAEMERNLISERTKAGMAAAKAQGRRFGPKHRILEYPRRLREFSRLWAEGLFPDGPLSNKDVVDIMNEVDRKAPKIAGPSMISNWKTAGFPGFTPPADVPLSETQDPDEGDRE